MPRPIKKHRFNTRRRKHYGGGKKKVSKKGRTTKRKGGGRVKKLLTGKKQRGGSNEADNSTNLKDDCFETDQENKVWYELLVGADTQSQSLSSQTVKEDADNFDMLKRARIAISEFAQVVDDWENKRNKYDRAATKMEEGNDEQTEEFVESAYAAIENVQRTFLGVVTPKADYKNGGLKKKLGALNTAVQELPQVCAVKKAVVDAYAFLKELDTPST